MKIKSLSLEDIHRLDQVRRDVREHRYVGHERDSAIITRAIDRIFERDRKARTPSW